MLKNFIRARLASAEKKWSYDMSYGREILDADLGAFLRVAPLQGLSTYRRDVPAAVWHAVRLAGTLAADCGPCSQLMVTMAEHDGVPADILRAVAVGDDAALPDDVRLGVQYVRATLARRPESDELRAQIVARWGRRGLLSLAFGLVASQLYPTLKYALGYGRACSRLEVSGRSIARQGARAAA
jgi:hypothetical protein